MFIQQIYTNCLCQASYYLESDGEAAIVDPIRDVEGYVQLAKERNAVIKYVFETHLHADFVSGHLELASLANAVIVYGPNTRTLYHSFVASDGEEFKLGKEKIKVLHTPGHTIESSCFLVINELSQPTYVFTGDTLFVGDVGRPDLLSGNLSKEVLAEQLYYSVHEKLLSLPDSVIIYPGHGPGSSCGKITKMEMESSIGDQRKFNNAILQPDLSAFVKYVTTDLPFAPSYFFKDVKINTQGYTLLGEVVSRSLKPLNTEEFIHLMEQDCLVLDTRSTEEFALQHIPGSINIAISGEFAFWVGSLLRFNVPILLVTEPGKETESIRRLARVGFENVKGYLKGLFAGWDYSRYKLSSIKSTTFNESRRIYHPEHFILIDVRDYKEVKKEKIMGSINIPLQQINELAEHLDKNANYIIYCQGGYRSMIAASILKAKGFKNLLNVKGGIAYLKETQPEVIQH